MADGNPLLQGLTPATVANNRSQSPNYFINEGPGACQYVIAGKGGWGLYSASQDNDAIFSVSSSNDGVVGQTNGSLPSAGVRGVSWSGTAAGVWGEGSVGVVGQSARENGIGVEGDASARGGVGVYAAGTATDSTGLYATASSDAVALKVQGRASFSSSGTLVVPSGATSATVTGLSLGAASLILAVVQQDRPGVAVRAAVPNSAAGEIVVHLTQAPNAPTIVAWFALN